MPKVGEEVKARWSDKRLYLAKIMKISSEGKSTSDLCPTGCEGFGLTACVPKLFAMHNASPLTGFLGM